MLSPDFYFCHSIFAALVRDDEDSVLGARVAVVSASRAGVSNDSLTIWSIASPRAFSIASASGFVTSVKCVLRAKSETAKPAGEDSQTLGITLRK